MFLVLRYCFSAVFFRIRRKMKKEICAKIFVVLLALVIIGAMLLVYFLWVVKPPIAPGAKLVTLEILYLDKEYRYQDLQTTSNTVGELLDAFDEELELGVVAESSTYGRFLTELKNTPQNQQEGIYYTYEINGEYPLGIDEQTIKNGDIITFKYGKSEYDGSWNEIGYTLKSGGDNTSFSTPLGTRMIVFISIVVVVAVLTTAAIVVLIYKNASAKNK